MSLPCPIYITITPHHELLKSRRLFTVPRTLSNCFYPWIATMEEYVTVGHPVKSGGWGG